MPPDSNLQRFPGSAWHIGQRTESIRFKFGFFSLICISCDVSNWNGSGQLNDSPQTYIAFPGNTLDIKRATKAGNIIASPGRICGSTRNRAGGRHS
jgi:hypothetical protein